MPGVFQTPAPSLVKARQSGLWHRDADGSERERSAPAARLLYDPVAIGAEVDALARADLAWSTWFTQEQIEPLYISYEAFAKPPVATVRAVCVELGIDPPDPSMISPGVAKLADRVNLEWATRYRADVGLPSRD